MRDMDPSMLIGFLISNEQDWQLWKDSLDHMNGKPIIHIAQAGPSGLGSSMERPDAIDEVEAYDDDEDER